MSRENGIIDNGQMLNPKQYRKSVVVRISPQLRQLLQEWHVKATSKSSIPMTKNQTELMFVRNAQRVLEQPEIISKPKKGRAKAELIFRL